MLPTISNLDELVSEKRRLKLELAETTQSIKDDFEKLKHSLDPLKVAGGVIENLLVNKHGGILNDGLRTMVGKFSYNILLSFLPWPFKIGISYALQNATSNYVYANKGSFFDKAITLVSNLTKSLKSNKGSSKKESNGLSNF